MSGEPSYVDQLGVVLRRGEVGGVRAFLRGAAERFGDARQVAEVERKSDAEMEELMHRMILARPDLEELHRGSRAYLESRGS